MPFARVKLRARLGNAQHQNSRLGLQGTEPPNPTDRKHNTSPKRQTGSTTGRDVRVTPSRILASIRSLVRFETCAATASLPSYHDWMPGVALEGTLAQADRPYRGSLAFGAAVRLGLPSHTPSRERPRLCNASQGVVQLPLASGCLQQGPIKDSHLRSFIYAQRTSGRGYALPPTHHSDCSPTLS